MTEPHKDPAGAKDAPEVQELSDDALESVAGGCQIGQSVADGFLRTTYEPPILTIDTKLPDLL